MINPLFKYEFLKKLNLYPEAEDIIEEYLQSGLTFHKAVLKFCEEKKIVPEYIEDGYTSPKIDKFYIETVMKDYSDATNCR